MKLTTLVAIFALLCSGLFFNHLCAEDYCRIAQQIEQDHINYVRKTRGYPVYVTGGGMMDCVERIGIGFSAGKPRSVDEARRIIIPLIDHYLDLINRSRRIRPYLIQYPFPNENLEYMIDFNDWQTYPGSNEVIQTYLLNGKLYYMFKLKDGKFRSTKSETFAEAKRILEAEQSEKTSQRD